jgi:hypothetical protein
MKNTACKQPRTPLPFIRAFTLLPLAAALLLAGCTSSGSQQSAPGAPQKLTRAERWKAQGWLQVYTTQRWKHIPGSPSSYVHATYKLLTPEGRLYMDVLNVGPMDEPEAVRLDPGNYVVEAWAFKPEAVKAPLTRGAVRIPVTVETGKTTVLHLDK